jgi:hypothetical protein
MDTWTLHVFRSAAACTLLALCFTPGPCIAQPLESPAPGPPLPKPPTDLSNWLAFVLAAEAGGGIDAGPSGQATAQGGVKLGMPVSFDGAYPSGLLRTCTLDLAYDRVQSRGGFSTELSVMLPIVRFPGPQADETQNYMRIYLEPGLGYRAGGPSRGYGSAKMMVAFFSDRRLTLSDAPPSLFVEIQRRFPFGGSWHGDSRIMVGLMFAACNRCGLD